MAIEQFLANPRTEPKLWNYFIGDLHHGRSIGLERMQHFRELAAMNDGQLTLALHRHEGDFFTEWHPLTGHLDKRRSWFGWHEQVLQTAPDIQRSILDNEIIVESDYPTYEENREAASIIGTILERKGFTPHYYYSGGKSVHIHLYFDWNSLLTLDLFVQRRIMATHSSPGKFKKDFMKWLRAQMIDCWGLKARTFDVSLASASHLIRSELSRNKKGCKTFLGYDHRDMPPFPIICNEETGLLPQLGAIRLSCPPNVEELAEEYLHTLEYAKRRMTSKRRENALSLSLNPDKDGELKGCAAFMLSDAFADATDGFQRASYMLTNELRRVYGDAAEAMLQDWNARMGNKVQDKMLAYRFAQEKTYRISHEEIHALLLEAGFSDPEAICKARDKA